MIHVGKIFMALALAKDLLDTTLNAEATTGKIDKWDFINTKCSRAPRTPLRERKIFSHRISPFCGRKYLQMPYLIRD